VRQLGARAKERNPEQGVSVALGAHLQAPVAHQLRQRPLRDVPIFILNDVLIEPVGSGRPCRFIR
jgi:hypothetical protein